MGIKLLTTFVKKNKVTLMKDIDIKGSNLVIDGYAALFTLLSHKGVKFGGNYRDTYLDLKAFFSLLLFHEITPFVVLDGASNLPIKLNTYLKRMKDAIDCLKGMDEGTQGAIISGMGMANVLVNVLEELNIKYVFAEREADAVTAVIANKVGGFVLTNDSDFFVFDVHCGVIHLDDIYDLSKENSTLKVFHSESLIKLLNTDRSQLKYLAVMLGCDYSNDTYLESLQKNLRIFNLWPVQKRFNFVKKHLSKTRSSFYDCLTSKFKKNSMSPSFMKDVENILLEYSLENAKEEADKLYNIMFSQKPKTMDITLLNKANRNRDALLHSIEQLVHCGKLHGSILDILFSHVHFYEGFLENISKPLSEIVSDCLLKYIYHLLFRSFKDDVMITEYIREGENVVPRFLIAQCSDYCLPEFTEETDMMELLLKIMNFRKPVPETLINHSVFLLTVNYLIHESSKAHVAVDIAVVEVFVLMYVVLQKDVSFEIDKVTFSADLAHVFACFNSIYFMLLMLNTLFGEVFKVHPIFKVVDGKLLHYLLMKKKESAEEGTSLSKKILPENDELYVPLLETLKNANSESFP